MRIGQFVKVLKTLKTEIKENPLSVNTLKDIWKRDCSTTYSTKPIMRLTIDNYNTDKNHLLYCLKNHPNKYSLEDIKKLGVDLGIHIDSKTKKRAFEIIISCIENKK